MKAREFIYWMQGYFEILGPAQNHGGLTTEQVAIIKRHLDLVFFHEIDPEAGGKMMQEALNKIHQELRPPKKEPPPPTPPQDDPMIRC